MTGRDPTERVATGSSPVSPIEGTAPFAGSSQDQANERAIPEGNRCPNCYGSGLMRGRCPHPSACAWCRGSGVAAPSPQSPTVGGTR